MPFTCEHCHYTTTVKSSFNDHLRSKRHLDNLSTPFPFNCDGCKRGFKTKCGLRLHKSKCQHKEPTDVSNTVVTTEVVTRDVFDKFRADMNNVLMLLNTAISQLIILQSTMDSYNTRDRFQSF